MAQVDLDLTPAAGGYALVFDRVHHLELRDGLAEPRLGDDDALIQGMYAALCGTDLEVIDGLSDRVRPPAVLGHEWAGRVAAVGRRVDPSWVGSFVVGDNVVGSCEVGFELPGGLASHFVIPARNLRPLRPSLHQASACLIEPLAVSVRAVRAAGLRPSDSVLVLGDGVIGLFVARIASLEAKEVMLIGRDTDRLEVARELGVRSVHLQQEVDFDALADREAWTVVFEVTGRQSGLNAAIQGPGPHARVVLVGDYGRAPVAIEATAIMRKELQVVGSNASRGAWDEAVRLASSRSVNLDAVSQIVVPIDRWAEALAAARERRALRVVLRHQAAA